MLTGIRLPSLPVSICNLLMLFFWSVLVFNLVINTDLTLLKLKSFCSYHVKLSG